MTGAGWRSELWCRTTGQQSRYCHVCMLLIMMWLQAPIINQTDPPCSCILKVLTSVSCTMQQRIEYGLNDPYGVSAVGKHLHSHTEL